MSPAENSFHSNANAPVIRSAMSPLLRASLEQPEQPTDYERTEQLFNAAWQLLEATGTELSVNDEPTLVTPEPVMIPMGSGQPLYARLAAKQFTSSTRRGLFRRSRIVNAYGNPSIIYSIDEQPGDHGITTVEGYFSRLSIRFVRITGACYLTTGIGFHCEINNPDDITFTREVLGKLAYANGYNKQLPAELLAKPSDHALPTVPRPVRPEKSYKRPIHYRPIGTKCGTRSAPVKSSRMKHDILREWMPDTYTFRKRIALELYGFYYQQSNNYPDLMNHMYTDE